MAEVVFLVTPKEVLSNLLAMDVEALSKMTTWSDEVRVFLMKEPSVQTSVITY